MGYLTIVSDDPHRKWLENEVEMLLSVGHQLSLSVQHARLFSSREQQAFTDPLTGCMNRRAFDVQLENSFQAASNDNRSLSLIMVDLDGLKSLNDTCGHHQGDEAIRILGQILLEETSEHGSVTRFGGDEFGLILPEYSADRAIVLAEQIRRRVEAIQIPRRVTASLGVATFPLHAITKEELFLSADAALYEAKESGRNNVRSSRILAQRPS